MAEVNYYLRHKNRPGPIWLSYRIPGGRLQRSLGSNIRVSPDGWNTNRQRVKSSHPHSKVINRLLDKVKVGLEGKFIELSGRGRRVTEQMLSEYFDELMGIVAKGKEVDLITFAERRAKETNLPARRNLATNLKKFSKEEKRSFLFDDLDFNFWDSFRDFLVDTGNQNSTTRKYLSTLQTTVREASGKYQLTTNRDLLNYKKELPKGFSRFVFLTSEEVVKMIYAKMPNKRLERIRDCFLCGCLTGLRYANWHYLDLNKYPIVEGGQFEFLELISAAKNRKQGYILILPEVRKVLEKYGGKLPIISSDKTRKYMKEVGELLGMDGEHIHIESVGKGEKEIRFKRYEKIGTHTGRRTFTHLLQMAEMEEKYINILTAWEQEGRTMAEYYDHSRFAQIASRDKFKEPLQKIVNEMAVHSWTYYKR